MATGIRLFRIGIVLLVACLVASLGRAGEFAYPGDENGARQLLQQFVIPGADHARLTATLKPNPEDYFAFFTGDAAYVAKEKYAILWASNPSLAPAPEQTELQLFKASSDDIKAGQVSNQDFPFGYSEIAKKIQPGLTIYTFKFVEPGKTVGLMSDGLTYINGHWVIFPKPWRVFEKQRKPASPGQARVGPKLSMDNKEVIAGTPALVKWSGTPGNQRDWINVAPVGTPDDKKGTWTYLNGLKNGTFEVRDLEAGVYEARLHYDWPHGGFNVVERLVFRVR